jgi:hypothetical protein
VTPPVVAFYISGHGFGHAVRQIAIINALLESASGRVRVIVRTNAPRWLFERAVRSPVALLPGATDTGVVQIDGLQPDEHATIRETTRFYETLPARLADERALLRSHDVALVVADAPPLACAAAYAAGIPAVVCSNFTWDWIYQEYFSGSREGAATLSIVREAYASASGWRLPMHGGFETVSPIVDVPLVARHARQDRPVEAVRHALGLPARERLALVSFGGYGAKHLPFDRLDCLAAWGLVVTARRGDDPPARGIHVVSEELIYSRGLQYEDLVRAVDVVVTKPGYGIISDCAANHTAVLYTSRGRFAEYDVLVREMPRWVRARFLPTADLLSGRWQAGLEAVHAAPSPSGVPARDGAAVVAAMIREQLGLT